MEVTIALGGVHNSVVIHLAVQKNRSQLPTSILYFLPSIYILPITHRCVILSHSVDPIQRDVSKTSTFKRPVLGAPIVLFRSVFLASTVTASTRPAPCASGEVKDCVTWFQVTADYTCDDMLGDTSMTVDEFYAMNPSVKTDCTGLNVRTYYYCYESPSLNNNCGGTTTAAVRTVSATTTDSGSPTKTLSVGVTDLNGAVTPTPTPTGMVGNYNKFHLVTSADTGCYDLAAANNIALSDFYS